MAGSIKYFVYTTDDGTDFAIRLDESNTEAVNAGTQDYPDAGTIQYELPRNVKPRRVIFANAARTVRRQVVALTPTIFNGVSPSSTFADPVSGQTLNLVQKKGEEVRVPIGADSGLNDGDAT